LRDLAFNNGKQIALAQDEQFLAIDLDFGSRVLGEQDLIVNFDIHGDVIAIFVAFARADGQDQTLLRFFLGRLGKDNATSGDILLLEGLYHNTAAEWFERECHRFLLK
jgi:hypothetical protein